MCVGEPGVCGEVVAVIVNAAITSFEACPVFGFPFWGDAFLPCRSHAILIPCVLVCLVQVFALDSATSRIKTEGVWFHSTCYESVRLESF